MRFNAQALRDARKDAGLTQEELAKKAGIGCNTVWYLESGRRVRPNTLTIEKIASALNRPFIIFFTLDPQFNEDLGNGGTHHAA